MTNLLSALLSHAWSGLLIAASVVLLGWLVLRASRRPGRSFGRLVGWLIAVGGLVLAAGSLETVRKELATARVTDTTFAATQTRGQMVMGVDQYTSAHVFEDLPDGGRVILDRDDPADTAGIATIRRHMTEIAADFGRGEFTKPFQVHDQVVPGTEEMTARRAAIQYAVVDRPRGGEVRLTSADPAAVSAIQRFLGFQRGAHHAAGHEHQ